MCTHNGGSVHLRLTNWSQTPRYKNALSKKVIMAVKFIINCYLSKFLYIDIINLQMFIKRWSIWVMGLLTKRQQTGKELDKGLFTNFMITFVPSLIIWGPPSPIFISIYLNRYLRQKYMYLKHDKAKRFSGRGNEIRKYILF